MTARRRRARPRDLEAEMALAIKLAGLPAPVREHAFARVEKLCPGCRGSGKVRGMRRHWIECPECRGSGVIKSGRGWRFDLAWLDVKLALEIDGGGFVAGRHGRGAGLRADAEKYSAAAIRGWRVLRAVGDHVPEPALSWVRAALEAR